VGERKQPQRGLGRGGPAEQGPGTEREQQLPRGRVVEPRDRGAERPDRILPAGQEQSAPFRRVLALRVAGMRTQCHGVAEQHPRFNARQGDSRKPHRTHAGGGLAVDAQALDVVAGRERQFGPADKAHGTPAKRSGDLADLFDPVEFVLRVGEPSVGDRAQREQRPQLDLVVAGTEPPHHRQGGLGVPDRRGPVTDLHGELSQHRMRHRRGPGAVSVGGQRERARSRRDRADRVASVLVQDTQPLAGGERSRPVLAVGEPPEPGHEVFRFRFGFRRVVREQHPHESGKVRALGSLAAQPNQDGTERPAARPAGHQRSAQQDHDRAARLIHQFRWRLPVEQRLGDCLGQDDNPNVLAADRPEQPERGEQLNERAPVTVGERAAQLVGQVDFLRADSVDGRELVTGR